MSLTLPVDPSQLPSGFCPQTLQELLNGFSNHQSVTFPGSFSGVTWQAAKPTDTSVTWGQLDTLGRPVRIYRFAQGAWLSLHPLVPGFGMIWFTTLPNFATFDGGDANPLSPLSGPMWEVVTATAARFPIGAGTLPSTTVLAIGDTGGEEKHTLTIAELPKHDFFIAKNKYDAGGTFIQPSSSNYAVRQWTAPSTTNTDYALQGNSEVPDCSLTNQVGGDAAQNNMPPYLVVAYLRRTAKLFYAIT